jgi:hypothetical protein
MPTLVASPEGLSLRLETAGTAHWSVGRDPSCDLVLTDPGISRFHATMFRQEGAYLILDHSMNGTLLFDDEAELSRTVFVDGPQVSGATPLPGGDTIELGAPRLLTPPSSEELGDVEIHQSLAELRVQQKQKRLSRIVGFEAHGLSDVEAHRAIVKMIYGTGEDEALAGLGTQVRPGSVLVFAGFLRHAFRFDE